MIHFNILVVQQSCGKALSDFVASQAFFVIIK